MFNYIPQLPVAEWMTSIVNWLTANLSGFFDIITASGTWSMDLLTTVLGVIPAFVWIIAIPILLFFMTRKKLGLPIFAFLGLLFIYNQNLWPELLDTFALVLIATLISIIIGVPLGIWMAKSQRAQSIIQPILDFMQTMPAFVYLIPAVAFFGIGMVPGIFASVIFALPPTVRMTNLGIQEVSGELKEAADAFGATGSQKLFGVELPLAKNSIFAGINQSLMLSLSMVVTASMIGAPGLGQGVLQALQRADVGQGFVNGVAIVILAIIMDRVAGFMNRPVTAKVPQTEEQRKRRRWARNGLIVALLLLVAGTLAYDAFGTDQREVTLATTQWEDGIASSAVVATILEDNGYKTNIEYLDPAIVFEAVASGDADATVAPWLPLTHGAMFEANADKIIDLGPNAEGTRNGLVVPAYMEVNSIDKLTDEAGQVITGIEPGAGITELTDNSLETYPNLNGWTQQLSSTGAMLVELEQALNNHEEIVITGWQPHWMFVEYDLKFLEDPKGTMGEPDNIHSLVRLGLEEDDPKLYQFLDNFEWTLDQQAEVMLEISNGAEPIDAARAWVDANPEVVEAWLPK